MKKTCITSDDKQIINGQCLLTTLIPNAKMHMEDEDNLCRSLQLIQFRDISYAPLAIMDQRR